MASASVSATTRAFTRLGLHTAARRPAAALSASRAVTSTATRHNSTTTSTTTSTTNVQTEQPAASASASTSVNTPSSSSPSSSSSPPSERRRTTSKRSESAVADGKLDALTVAESQADLAKSAPNRLEHLRKIQWSDDLPSSAREPANINAIQAAWEDFRMFRSARARLWVPDQVPSIGPKAETVTEWLDKSLLELDTLVDDLEAAQDEILRPVWKTMDSTAKQLALDTARFQCLHKLGWRTGYTAGYPAGADRIKLENRQAAVEQSAQRTKDGLRAFDDLQSADWDMKWDDWCLMTPKQRRAEEIEAWQARDRTLLYMDDTPGKQVLGSNVPRWYQTPQRAGKLVFLPNFTLKLVRNYTPPGKSYDPWKATFRAPLNLHKHAVRSFLLSVYGLRTTWIRSMIYRSPLQRNAQRQLRTGKGKTYKKIEVGLLEPFVFPSITEKQKTEDLFAEEYEIMQSRYMMRAGKRTYIKYRGGRALEQSKSPLRVLDPWQVDLLNPSRQETILESQNEKIRASKDTAAITALNEKSKPFLTMKNNKKWTKSHGNVLRILNEKRVARMKEVDARAEKIKKGRPAVVPDGSGEGQQQQQQQQQ
ncbi:unnamed protein product [Sympodiomycopsis kandeliae]